MAGRLADDLRSEGFAPTGRESPIDDEGELWSNGYDIVCDETGTLIDGNHHTNGNGSEEKVYRYRNSEKVKLPGGYLSSYEWGYDEEERFRY